LGDVAGRGVQRAVDEIIEHPPLFRGEFSARRIPRLPALIVSLALIASLHGRNAVDEAQQILFQGDIVLTPR
jgi:hypothetical protein